MDRIVNPTPNLPFRAEFVSVNETGKNHVVLEYFDSAKKRITYVHGSAAVLSTADYEKLIEASDKPKKLDKWKDPSKVTKSIKVAKGDMGEHGREIQDFEKKLFDEIDDDEDDFLDLEPAENPIKKQATLPKGKLKGKGDLTESSDHTVYQWRAINEALIERGYVRDEIAAIQLSLQGKEYAEGLGESAELNGPSADDMNAAIDATSPEGEKKNEISVDMDIEEVHSALENISRDTPIDTLQKGIKITVVKVLNGKVTKILPSTLIKTVTTASDEVEGIVAIGTDKFKLKLGTVVAPRLKQSEDTGQYHYIHRSDDIVEPKVNNVGV